LRRERGAKRPRDFSFAAQTAGAAVRPFHDARPLLQKAAWLAGRVMPLSRGRKIASSHPSMLLGFGGLQADLTCPLEFP